MFYKFIFFFQISISKYFFFSNITIFFLKISKRNFVVNFNIKYEGLNKWSLN